eukprot:g1942.t1
MGLIPSTTTTSSAPHRTVTISPRENIRTHAENIRAHTENIRTHSENTQTHSSIDPSEKIRSSNEVSASASLSSTSSHIALGISENTAISTKRKAKKKASGNKILPGGVVSQNFVRMDLKRKRWKQKSNNERKKTKFGAKRVWSKTSCRHNGYGGKEWKKKTWKTADRGVKRGKGRHVVQSTVIDRCIDVMEAISGMQSQNQSNTNTKTNAAQLKTKENTNITGTVNSRSASIPVCFEHGELCKEWKVRKAGPNKGRFFYACSLPRYQKCDFFQWKDDSCEDAVSAFLEDAGIIVAQDCQHNNTTADINNSHSSNKTQTAVRQQGGIGGGGSTKGRKESKTLAKFVKASQIKWSKLTIKELRPLVVKKKKASLRGNKKSKLATSAYLRKSIWKMKKTELVDALVSATLREWAAPLPNLERDTVDHPSKRNKKKRPNGGSRTKRSSYQDGEEEDSDLQEDEEDETSESENEEDSDIEDVVVVRGKRNKEKPTASTELVLSESESSSSESELEFLEEKSEIEETKSEIEESKSESEESKSESEETKSESEETKSENEEKEKPSASTTPPPSLFSSSVLKQTLQDHFGHESFRPLQEWCITRVLQEKSTVLVLPTGSGKSLCYQLPAMLLPGLTIVVSPLISLMQDQMKHLPPALLGACLNSQQTSLETAFTIRQLLSTTTKQKDPKTLEEIRTSPLKILFLSPERLFSPSFTRLLQHPKFPTISLCVVDEAHCVSEWSHNFRPAYLRLGQVIQDTLQAKAILALTATATKSTVHQICQVLRI